MPDLNMGGSAFPLSTPRMPPIVYNAARDQCIEALRTLYDVVVTPIPGPDKKDHGDIDILVACPTTKPTLTPSGTISTSRDTSSHPPSTDAAKEAEPEKDALDEIISVLGGVMSLRVKAKDGWSCNVAIPWPAHLLPPDASTSGTVALELDIGASPGINGDDSINEGSGEPSHEPEIPGLFIQVDTRICRDLQDLRWRNFKHAHGDIWNLLGTTIRPYGLTADEIGLHIRIPEVEESSIAKSKVLLTSDPGDVLEFLGLVDYPGTAKNKDLNYREGAVDSATEEYKGRNILTGSLHGKPVWQTPFPSGREMFEYVAKCRMFWLELRSPPSITGVAPNDSTNVHEAELSVDGHKKNPNVSRYFLTTTSAPVRENLKHNDRRRAAQRPMYKKWIDEFLPSLREQLLPHLKIQQDEETSESTTNSPSPTTFPLSPTSSSQQRHSLTVFPYPTSPRCTRLSIRLDAFASFPGSRSRYYTALRSHLREERTLAIKRGLKGNDWIPFPVDASTQFKGETRGAFRRILFEGSREFGVTLDDVEDGFPLREAVSWSSGEMDTAGWPEAGGENEHDWRQGDEGEEMWIEENVKRFVQRNWKKVGEAAERFYHGIVQARMAERMRKTQEAGKALP